MENIVITNDNIKVEISPLGAELKSVKVNGKERLWQGDEKSWKGQAPVLFPVCGKLKGLKFIHDGITYDLGAHGFARKSVFSVVSTTENCATFLLESSEETLKCYPFEFKFLITYTLTEKLSVEYKIENTGAGDMYFAIGSHEGYNVSEDISEYYVEFEKEEEFINVIHNDNGILTGEKVKIGDGKILQLDGKYFVGDYTIILENINSKSVTLKGKNDDVNIKVEFDGFSNLLFWQVHGAPFICIEPWTALPDRIDCNNVLKDKPGIIKLAKGENKVLTHKITF